MIEWIMETPVQYSCASIKYNASITHSSGWENTVKTENLESKQVLIVCGCCSSSSVTNTTLLIDEVTVPEGNTLTSCSALQN